ncbi:phosphatase PAP2 family protein [Streptomyces sp. CB01881]|uniref:phosphatase PAP2 family protein n=1 Tax=Streptomyces sp. CB01881 TaxID=2078691 RepID=UPI000CDC5B51|nr:phosphatase PAP2 family protein [Streptomyces sp. CB01881]AUY54031.1 phosphoesterase PA-phosphatase [Streptomyces sp. CB01881]TYC77891.1 phosphatase PAP2 family protein [Streptomyces sp. CB01881]
MNRRQAGLLAATFLGYLLVVAGVLLNSALVDLDWSVRLARPYERWPSLEPLLDNWVVAGQRGPSAMAAFAWLGWRAHRLRRLRPLLVMGAALLLLNVTVGGVKIVTGRLGPHYAHYVGSPELFSGGTIFPSGHTANAVVTWGVLAYLAVRWRRTGAVLAAATACSVGLTTVYLGTHWVTDVLAGWAAGLLVLLSLPLLEPVVTAAEQRLTARRARRRDTVKPAAPPPATPQPAPARSGRARPGRTQPDAARPHRTRPDRARPDAARPATPRPAATPPSSVPPPRRAPRG